MAALRAKLGAVRAQQAPWEARAAEVRGRIGCAAAERQMLLKRQGDAQQRLTVRRLPPQKTLSPTLAQTAERKMLLKRQGDAQQRLTVRRLSPKNPLPNALRDCLGHTTGGAGLQALPLTLGSLLPAGLKDRQGVTGQVPTQMAAQQDQGVV